MNSIHNIDDNENFIQFLAELSNAGVDLSKLVFVQNTLESVFSAKAFQSCEYRSGISDNETVVAIGSTTSSNLMDVSNNSSFDFGTSKFLIETDNFLEHLENTAEVFDVIFKDMVRVVFGVSFGYLFKAAEDDATGNVEFVHENIRSHYRPGKDLTPEQDELRIQNCFVFAEWLKNRYPDTSFFVKDRGFKGAPKIIHEWMIGVCPEGHGFDVGGGQFVHFHDGKRGDKFSVSTNHYLDNGFTGYSEAIVEGFNRLGINQSEATFYFTGKIRGLFFSDSEFESILKTVITFSNRMSEGGAPALPQATE